MSLFQLVPLSGVAAGCVTFSFMVPSFPVGVRDQPLDWQTAPPVHVLSYLVLGGKKDAMSKEVRGERARCEGREEKGRGRGGEE